MRNTSFAPATALNDICDEHDVVRSGGVCPVCDPDEGGASIAVRPGFWVFSGPFGGKTTLKKLLEAAAYPAPVAETDDVRKCLPGWDPQLWAAWRPNHPLHAKWKEIDAQVRAAKLAALGAGGVVISHDAPYDGLPVAPTAIFLWPGYQALFQRMEEYRAFCEAPANFDRGLKKLREKKITRALANQPSLVRARMELVFGQRLGAACHYWNKPEVVKHLGTDPQPGVVRVATAQEAFDIITGHKGKEGA